MPKECLLCLNQVLEGRSTDPIRVFKIKPIVQREVTQSPVSRKYIFCFDCYHTIFVLILNITNLYDIDKLSHTTCHNSNLKFYYKTHES